MKATFAAGCFWHVGYLFRKVKGVTDTCVGYTGGSFDNPTYQDVCSDRTGQAEAVQVDYDPTSLNRQGPDVGTQYRSAVFVHNEEQEKIAIESKQSLEKTGKFKKPIVAEIKPISSFYKAEDYHQKYFEKSDFLSLFF